MSYNYETEKPTILAPEKIGHLLKAKADIDAVTRQTGCIRYQEAFSLIPNKLAGTSWEYLAVLDYLVEQGFYEKINGDCGQAHILVRPFN